jgi:hypothetical protein
MISLVMASVQVLNAPEARAESPTMGQSAGFAQTSWMLLWGSDAEVDADLDAMVATGAKWLRFDFDWASAEPTPGSYRWTYIDRVVSKARARNLRILATPAYTPAWARPAGTSDKHGPTDPAAYAAFVKAAARRYAPMGVHHWEIWNEPNVQQFWQPQPNVSQYAAMLRAAAVAIRSVDAKAVVLSAGLAPAADTADGRYVSPRTFLSRLYQAGAGASFDAVGMHPYAWPYGISAVGDWNQWSSMPKTYDIMVANGDGAKKIWATEYGAPTGTNSRSVSEADQARFVKEAFPEWASHEWSGPVFWYSFRDAGTDRADLEDNFGLQRRDATAKPALAEFKRSMALAGPGSSTVPIPTPAPVPAPSPTCGAGSCTDNLIDRHWYQLGADRGVLGPRATGEVTTPDGIGRFRHYNYGSIYWTPSTGAWETHGGIRGTWARLGWERSVLGYPLTDEVGTPDGIGRFNHFQGGSVYWTPWTNAHEVYGAIRAKWSDLGWERSVLGYPVTGEYPTPDGAGRFNHFQAGSIYWTPGTNAQEIRGAIRAKWSLLGWERSVLGYPTTDELATPDGVGRFNHFQGGSVYWTPGTNAQAIHGAIRDRWAQMGWERSPLAYPTSDVYATATGQRADFQGGSIEWNRNTGTTVLR